MARTFAGERQREQLRYIDAQGQARVGTITTAPIFEYDVVVGGLGIMHDVTQEELLREASAQHARMAAAGELLHGVANELNNPLTALLAVADLQLASDTLGSGDRDAMSQIAAQANRVSHILSALLDATVTGREPISTFDVDRTIRRAIEWHGYTSRAAGITIETALAGALPPVQGDGHRLQQALVNLLANADEAIAESRGERRIHVVTRTERGRVLIEVSDTGHGIAPADLTRVFDPTFTTRSGRAGKGFGLSIARQIVQQHDGTLSVRSTLGQGTTFTVSLPVVIDASAAAADARRTPVSVASVALDAAETPVAAATRGTLLLVEDESTLRSAISRYLTRRGFEIDTAESGEIALDMLDARQYDLVLLDLRLQDMLGSDVYRVMQERLPEQAKRVLFMTGDLSRPAAADFVQSSGRPVIAKPFQLAELDALLASLVRPA